MTEPDLNRLLRLLGLGLLSAALHLGTLAWMARRATPRTPPARVPLAVAVRLAQPAPPQQPTPAATPTPAASAARPAAPARPAPSIAPSAAAGLTAAAPGQDQDQDRGPRPGRYTVRMPRSVELTYDVSPGPGQPLRATPSRLVWESDGDHYRLSFENVPAPDGGPALTFTSLGAASDSGITPNSTAQESEGGASVGIVFDHQAGRVEFESGASAELRDNDQDTVSILMQLTGIGQAQPLQFQDNLTFKVHTGSGPTVVRFDVIGMEQIEGANGMLEAMHLSQQPRPGKPRLEVWLAPAMDWYPVQLRTSAPNGLVTLQRLRSMTQAAPPAAP